MYLGITNSKCLQYEFQMYALKASQMVLTKAKIQNYCLCSFHSISLNFKAKKRKQSSFPNFLLLRVVLGMYALDYVLRISGQKSFCFCLSS